ncbi:MAG: hypothetical protein ACRD4C_08880 [Candidatus Acidiferrales bacterium]
MSEGRNKVALARALGVSRASLYYVPRMKEKDWRLKVRLEEKLQISSLLRLPSTYWGTWTVPTAGAEGHASVVATVLDLYTRRILGIQVAVRKGAALTIQALSNALLHHPRPGLFHSDNGSDGVHRAAS